MMQTRFGIKNDPCDETLLQVVACINCLACLVQAFADEDTANSCKTLADCVNAPVCSCMLTQHEIQLEELKKGFEHTPYNGMNPKILNALPPQQQEMMQLTKAGSKA